MKSSASCIFFDGASKGNPGISGARGLLILPDRSSKTSFNWGLGIMSNNQAESYSLLKACQLAKEAGFMSIQVYGDSGLLIKRLNLDGLFNNPALNLILQRIQNFKKEFEKAEFFHILQELNGRADSLASKGFLLAQGQLSHNGEFSKFQPIQLNGFSFFNKKLHILCFHSSYPSWFQMAELTIDV